MTVDVAAARARGLEPDLSATMRLAAPRAAETTARLREDLRAYLLAAMLDRRDALEALLEEAVELHDARMLSRLRICVFPDGTETVASELPRRTL